MIYTSKSNADEAPAASRARPLKSVARDLRDCRTASLAETAETAGRMERQLQHWGARLHELVAHTEHLGSHATLNYRQHIEDLRAKYALVQSKLSELRNAGAMAYHGLRAELDNAWKELADAFKAQRSGDFPEGPKCS